MTIYIAPCECWLHERDIFININKYHSIKLIAVDI